MPACHPVGARPLYEGKCSKTHRSVDGPRQEDKPAFVIIPGPKANVHSCRGTHKIRDASCLPSLFYFTTTCSRQAFAPFFTSIK
jgi:hypothetical protein